MCRYHRIVLFHSHARFGGYVMQLEPSDDDMRCAWTEHVIEHENEVIRLRAEIDPLRIAYRDAMNAWEVGMGSEADAIEAEEEMTDAIDAYSDAYMLWEMLAEY